MADHVHIPIMELILIVERKYLKSDVTQPEVNHLSGSDINIIFRYPNRYSWSNTSIVKSHYTAVHRFKSVAMMLRISVV